MYFNSVIGYIFTIHVCFHIVNLQQKLGKCTVMTPTQNGFGSQSKICRLGWRGWTVEGTLHGEQDEESHHQTEQTHGLRQGEAQDSQEPGVRRMFNVERGGQTAVLGAWPWRV